MVSTTDFFYPLVEDPYQQGRIACANVLSDMYALGVCDVDNLLMLLAVSVEMTPLAKEVVTRRMIQGFDDMAKFAGTQVTGGQTVQNPWPIIGGVAQSMAQAQDIIMPVNACVGDVLVLTKPLGIQVAVNVKQWMSQANNEKWQRAQAQAVISRDDALRAYLTAQRQMTRLNRTAARLMHRYQAHAATDVTGFGILGHTNNLAQNQKAKVSFVIHTLPLLSGLRAVNDNIHDFKLMRGLAAETSGGLLICLPRESALSFCKEIEELEGCPAWIIGDVVAGDNTASLLPLEQLSVIETELLPLASTSSSSSLPQPSESNASLVASLPISSESSTITNTAIPPCASALFDTSLPSHVHSHQQQYQEHNHSSE